MAHDANLVIKESARLVRMVGTRAPSTMPAASASGMKDRLFCQHVAQIGAVKTSAFPATGDSTLLILAAVKLIAL